jgi:hypothetical protein
MKYSIFDTRKRIPKECVHVILSIYNKEPYENFDFKAIKTANFQI